MIINENVEKCFNKICENFGIVAGLNISEPLLYPGNHEKTFLAFVDIHTSSHFDVSGRELLLCHIKSKKDIKIYVDLYE